VRSVATNNVTTCNLQSASLVESVFMVLYVSLQSSVFDLQLYRSFQINSCEWAWFFPLLFVLYLLVVRQREEGAMGE
jgi:hypothetical protein